MINLCMTFIRYISDRYHRTCITFYNGLKSIQLRHNYISHMTFVHFVYLQYFQTVYSEYAKVIVNKMLIMISLLQIDI